MEILAAMGLAAVIFAAGLMLMHRVDRWLQRVRWEPDEASGAESGLVRIGVCDPLAAGSLSEALAQQERGTRAVPVRLLCGTEREVLQAMREHRLDVAVLPEGAHAPGHACPVLLSPAALLPDRGSVPMEPISPGPVRQKLVWTAAGAPAAERLLRILTVSRETAGGGCRNVV